jgi:hypothetical protein
MPIMTLKTTGSKQVWASADGKIKIFELNLEYEGKPVKAKTYSAAIATIGWEGEVETYEKEGRNGVETFVKQPPKEDGTYGNSTQTNSQQSGRSSYTPKDEKAIQSMWAIGQAVQLTIATYKGSDALGAIEGMANELYGLVEIIKNGRKVEIETIPDVVHPVTDDPIDLSQVEEAFGPVQQLPLAGTISKKETVWLGQQT